MDENAAVATEVGGEDAVIGMTSECGVAKLFNVLTSIYRLPTSSDTHRNPDRPFILSVKINY